MGMLTIEESQEYGRALKATSMSILSGKLSDGTAAVGLLLESGIGRPAMAIEYAPAGALEICRAILEVVEAGAKDAKAEADTASLNRLQTVELLYDLQLTTGGKVRTVARGRLQVEADVTGAPS